VVAHILHDDVHQVGLVDGCPRCEEHTLFPESSLDREMRIRLLAGHIYTENDRRAAERLKECT
jgi:hypothetical protein